MPDRFARRILDHIADRRYQPRTLHRLADDLSVPGEQREAFEQAVRALLDSGELVRGNADTIGLPPVGEEMIGKFRSHHRGFGFVMPDNATEHGDLFIPPGKSGEAMDGDRVRAKVVHERGRSRRGQSPYTGRVVEVLQRADRQFVGVLKQRGSQYLVEVDGRAIAEPILIRDATSTNARAGDKVVVDILEYPDADRNEIAEGVIVEVLGEAGIPDVETRSVMRAHGLAEKFDKKVMDEARAASRKMEGTDERVPDDREDQRDVFICTIDPPDAKDYDDAISITHHEPPLDDGAAWELGVHIADVAHFVEPDGPLDQQAYNRGNSTYLPRKVIPMLPEVLSNGVCSLQAEVDRFAKSVFIRYDASGKVLSQRFSKTVIRSAKRLTYLEAQALIEDDIREARKHTKGEAKYPRELIKTLKLMDELAKTIRQRRLSDGMITLGLPEVELVYSDSGHVIDAEPEDDAFTHTLIEMFMVEANEAAARVFHALDIPMVRRVHPDPDAHGLKDLRTFARVAGYNIPAHPSRQELQWLLEKVRDTPAQHAVHMAVLKTLSKAEYAPVPIGHFALASEHYTHFTSPIRRYPDFVVHRALNALIEATGGNTLIRYAGGPKRPKWLTKALRKKLAQDPRVPDEEALTQIGRHCSDTERNSESAERDLRKYLVLQLLESKLGEDFPATVTGVAGQGAFLQIDHYLVDGFVKLPDLPGDKADRWQLNPNTGALVAQRSGRTIAIGDRFTIRIAKVDLASRQMELVVLDDRKPRRGRGGKGDPASESGKEKFTRKKKRRSSPEAQHLVEPRDRSNKVSRRKSSSAKKKQSRRRKRR
ncbi:MAG: VacB/RNase II family 3'-5' exoribonuclease [Planctomycetota bacterium]